MCDYVATISRLEPKPSESATLMTSSGRHTAAHPLLLSANRKRGKLRTVPALEAQRKNISHTPQLYTNHHGERIAASVFPFLYFTMATMHFHALCVIFFVPLTLGIDSLDFQFRCKRNCEKESVRLFSSSSSSVQYTQKEDLLHLRGAPFHCSF